MPYLDQRNITPERCNADNNGMKQLVELARKCDCYFARLFTVKVYILIIFKCSRLKIICNSLHI